MTNPITTDAQALAVFDDIRWFAHSAMTVSDNERFSEARAYLAVRLASTSPAPDGWQPIESAPANTDVLVWVPGSCVDMRIAMLCESGWLDTGCNRLRQKPTRWAPLPAAPQPVVEKGNG